MADKLVVQMVSLLVDMLVDDSAERMVGLKVFLKVGM